RNALIASQVSRLKNCGTWNVPSIPAINHNYFDSTIPTLLTAGSYDTKTSPAQAYLLAEHFSRSYVTLFPTMSHSTGWSDCPGNIMSDFLAHPNQKPDTSCVGLMAMIWL